MTCPRCGRPLQPLSLLARQALRLAGAAGRLDRAFERMRLAIPQDLVAAKRELVTGSLMLAAGLACHAGTCAVPEVAHG